MKPDPERAELALGVDVLAPEGYGEIIGGGERLADLDLLLQRIKEHDLPQEAFEWYLDLRRYGTVPHGGFGMGIERVVAGSAGSSTSARRSRFRACCIGCIRRRLETVEACASSSWVWSLRIMKIGLISLGCPKNLVDSEVMLGLAQRGGPRAHADRGERRRARRQHLRVHRLGEAGVDRRDPRDGAAQERRAPASA